VVHASALHLLTIAAALVLTAQQVFISFQRADVSVSPRLASSRGVIRHVLTLKNARSTRRERRIQPIRTLIV
jgi:hypothetical protein